MTHFDVVVVGSLNLDLVVRTVRLPGPGETVSGSDYQEFPGGKGLNQAVAAARAGASVALVGAVGDDSAGTALREVVRAEGIDDRWLDTIPGVATGRALIQVDENAENSIVVVAGANNHVRWPTDPPTSAVALAQLEIPLATVLHAFDVLLASGSTTILNPAPAAGLPSELLAATSVVVPNEHELELLGGRNKLSASGIETLLVTRGSAGVDVHTQDHSERVAAYEVTPLDTTGAGDSFCGNLAARLASGDTLRTAVEWAAAAGALATTVAGAVPSLPLATATQALVDTP